MSDLDLTEAIEAGVAAMIAIHGRLADEAPGPYYEPTYREVAEAAVRAAAPFIERAVREAFKREVWDRINRWQDDPETRLKAFAISHTDLESAREERDLARAALEVVLPVLSAARAWAGGIGEVQGFADRQADLLAAVDAYGRRIADA
jgi:hypothetical protein